MQEISPELKVKTPKKVYKSFQSKEVQEEEIFVIDNISTPKSRKRGNKDNDSDAPKCKRLKSIISKATKALKKEKDKYNRLHRKMYGSI